MPRESADQELAGIGRTVLRGDQATNRARLGVASLQEGRSSALRQPLLIVWAAVGVVLLIGCANIAGLLLARAAARTREIATRMAIGGGRGAIASQLLVERLFIAAVGAALGIGVGAALVEWLSRIADQELLPIATPSLDVRVLALTAILGAIVTGVLAGLAPAIEASLVDLRVALASGGGRGMTAGSRHWSRRLLVTLEVSLAVLLLVGAGLLVRSVQHLNALAPGFDASNVLAASFSLDDARYASPEKVTALFDEGVARLSRIPGVEAAAAGLSLPYKRGPQHGRASPRWARSRRQRAHHKPDVRHARLLRRPSHAAQSRPRHHLWRSRRQRARRRRERSVRTTVSLAPGTCRQPSLDRQYPGSDRRGHRRHRAGEQLRQLRARGADSRALCPCVADDGPVPRDGAHVVLAELGRADSRAAGHGDSPDLGGRRPRSIRCCRLPRFAPSTICDRSRWRGNGSRRCC